MVRSGEYSKSDESSVSTEQDLEKGLSNEVRAMMQESSPDFGMSEASHVVTSALRPRLGQETDRWLSSLAEQAGTAQHPAPTVVAASGSDFNETVKWVDQLFQQISILASAFNKTTANPELVITVEHAQAYEKQAQAGSNEPEVKLYRGRVTTSQWALGVIGQEERIAVCLIPSAMLLAFTSGRFTDRDFTPLVEVLRGKVNGTATWTVGGEAAPLSAIPSLAKKLLGDLIRVASGVISEAELYASGQNKPNSNETVAVGYSTSQESTGQVAPASGQTSNVPTRALSDACRSVDSIVDGELRRLYEEASKLRPDSEFAAPTRTQISSLEKFRSQMRAVFEEYTRTIQ